MTREGLLKHKELFNKWLDGSEIQFLSNSNEWIDLNNPSWDENIEYRVKPYKIDIEDCHFNEIEYKVDKIGKVVEVRVDRFKINNKTKSTLFKDKEIAEAYAVLPKLIRLRDEYNEGRKFNYKNKDYKYSVGYHKDDLDLINNIYTQRILVFKTKEIRNKFLEDYKDLIEIAKPLL